MDARMWKFFLNQVFQPSWWGVFITPFFLIRRPLFIEIRKLAPSCRGLLLDFGCGRKPYASLFQVERYVGVDVASSGHDHTRSQIDVVYDGKTLPFSNDYFDALVTFEVLEHIFNPHEILTEINRVMKPGASMIMTVPFCWNEHEIPYDYARYSSYGLRHLLQQCGFEVISLKKTGNHVQVIAQLVILYLFELFKPLKVPGYALTMLFAIPLTLSGLFFGLLLPRDKKLYFNNVVFAKKR